MNAAAIPRFGALVALLAAAQAGCGRPAGDSAPSSTAAVRTAATVARAPFGELPDGRAIDEFTLTNAAGDSVRVLTYGGIVTSINVRDREGNRGDVVLGHDSLAGYLKDNSHFGGIVGRYANRIGGARFTIDGRVYELAANNGPNSLHGGLEG